MTKETEGSLLVRIPGPLVKRLQELADAVPGSNVSKLVIETVQDFVNLELDIWLEAAVRARLEIAGKKKR